MTDDIIARLEKATGPNKELDWEIFVLLNPDKISVKRNQRYLYGENYTGSVDAARSLSNWILCYASDIGADGMALVKLGNPSVTPTIEVIGIAMTLERAWCIAALKARAASPPPSDDQH